MKIIKNNINGWDIKVVEIDGIMFALDGWNGEIYMHCWKCDETGTAIDDKEYRIREHLVETEDGDFEVESYEVM